MDKKLYDLEVERTRNLGSMTSALLMLASSMDALTGCNLLTTSHLKFFHFMSYVLLGGLPSDLHFICAPNSPIEPLWPFALQAMLFPR